MLQRVDHFAELLAEPAGQGAFEFHGRAAGRIEKGQARAVAHLVAQHDQRQGLFRREIRRRQEIAAGDVILLLILVVAQRHARGAAAGPGRERSSAG